MKLRFLCLAGLMFVTLPAPARAAFVTYTNQAAWAAAVSGQTVLTENFNTQAVRNFASTINETGFNGFSLTGLENGDNAGIRNGGTSGNINGSKFLGWQNGNGGVGPTINFVLAAASSAFAFNWRDTDPTDEYELAVNGSYFFNPPFSSGTGFGFFGIVETSGNLINVLTIRNATGQSPGGFVDPFGIDNVRLSAAAPVPEPASLATWGLGAIGMMFARRRRNRRNSTIAS